MTQERGSLISQGNIKYRMLLTRLFKDYPAILLFDFLMLSMLVYAIGNVLVLKRLGVPVSAYRGGFVALIGFFSSFLPDVLVILIFKGNGMKLSLRALLRGLVYYLKFVLVIFSALVVLALMSLPLLLAQRISLFANPASTGNATLFFVFVAMLVSYGLIAFHQFAVFSWFDSNYTVRDVFESLYRMVTVFIFNFRRAAIIIATGSLFLLFTSLLEYFLLNSIGVTKLLQNSEQARHMFMNSLELTPKAFIAVMLWFYLHRIVKYYFWSFWYALYKRAVRHSD